MNKFELKNIEIKIENKVILDNINFTAEPGDIIAVIGPNGAGKSTLFKAIMNHYSTNVSRGNILYGNKDIKELPTDEIARLGFYYFPQNPIELEGVKVIDLYKLIVNNSSSKKNDLFELYSKTSPLYKQLGLDQEILNRDNNFSFSGGQKKKNELIQMMLFNPSVILLDEIDSGADVDTIRQMGNIINQTKKDKIILIISHHQELLELIKPNKTILIANNIVCNAGDYDFLMTTLKDGFSKYKADDKEDSFDDVDFLKNVR